MAIQIPNPGTGNGASGDNEFVLWSKVKDNFSDQTNAASKLVGVATGQVPLAENLYKAMYSRGFESLVNQGSEANADNLEVGSKVLFPSNGQNNPTGDAHWVIHTEQGHATNGATRRQFAMGQTYGGESDILTRVRSYNGSWSTWRPLSTAKMTYNTTTASGANVVVDSSGILMRSTSSERYKDILAPLELDDARYADAMALKPIVYRSTADADNPAYHYYSFSAEELGTYDPAFTLWRDTETVIDADGNVTEQPLAERQAEGININALLAMGHAIAIKQGDLIKDLQEQVNTLKAKLEV